LAAIRRVFQVRRHRRRLLDEDHRPKKAVDMEKPMQVRTYAYLFAAILAVVVSVFSANAEEPSNIFRLGVGYMNVDGGTSQVGSFRAEFDDTSQLQFGYERKLSELIGLDFGVRSASPEITFDGSDTSKSVAFATLTFGSMFHLARGPRVDLFLGPQLGLSALEDIKTPQGKARSKANLALGARLGADVRIGRGWAVGVGVEYQAAKLRISDEGKFKGEGDFKLNPLSASVNASYRF
jgi:opacity protein-like surface antigen